MAPVAMFFMDPPPELKKLRSLPAIMSTEQLSNPEIVASLEKAYEDAVACMSTDFEHPREQKAISAKQWFFRLKNMGSKTPVFCNKGIGLFLECPSQFDNMYASHLKIMDAHKTVSYSIGVRLLHDDGRGNKNSKRQLFNYWILECVSQMKESLPEPVFNDMCTRKDRGSTEPFIVDSNPVRVPNVQKLFDFFIGLVENNELKSEKSAFNRRLRPLRNFLRSMKRTMFIVAGRWTSGCSLLIELKGHISAQVYNEEVQQSIVHRMNIYAVSVDLGFIKQAWMSFANEYGRNGTKRPECNRLVDPSGKKRIFYGFPDGHLNNELYQLVNGDPASVTMFAERLLLQLSQSGAIPKNSKNARIKCNWIVSKLNLPMVFALDATNFSTQHDVYVEKLHNCYTMDELFTIQNRQYCVFDLFIPVSGMGCFMLICTEHVTALPNDTIRQGEGDVNAPRIVYIPHGSALVLPCTAYHASGLQSGLTPSVVLQIQVSINTQTNKPALVPPRTGFQYMDGQSTMEHMKIPSLKELSVSADAILRNLSYVSAFFLR